MKNTFEAYKNAICPTTNMSKENFILTAAQIKKPAENIPPGPLPIKKGIFFDRESHVSSVMGRKTGQLAAEYLWIYSLLERGEEVFVRLLPEKDSVKKFIDRFVRDSILD